MNANNQTLIGPNEEHSIVAPRAGDADLTVGLSWSATTGRQVLRVETEEHAEFTVTVNHEAVLAFRNGRFTAIGEELDYDTVAAIGLDGTGMDADPRFPYTEASLTPAEAHRLEQYRTEGTEFEVVVRRDYEGVADTIAAEFPQFDDEDFDGPLDDLVHDVADGMASTVNNSGKAAQIEYLLSQGVSEENIRGRLRAATPATDPDALTPGVKMTDWVTSEITRLALVNPMGCLSCGRLFELKRETLQITEDHQPQGFVDTQECAEACAAVGEARGKIVTFAPRPASRFI